MTRIRTRFAFALSLASAAAGCNDFDLPSELSREQIVAVRSTPAALDQGTRGQLDALIAGPDGVVDGAELHWSIDPPVAGASIESGEGATWLAVDSSFAGTSVDLLLTVQGQEGELTARKNVPVTGQIRDNPGPMGLAADGQPIAGEGLRVAAGAAVQLSAESNGADASQVSWFATLGEIELYRRNPTEMVAPAEPGDGWLIAVLRDGAGGTAWRIVSLSVGE